MGRAKTVRRVVRLVGFGVGAFGAARELQTARGKRDNLALFNAILNFAAVLTGAALVIRSLRTDDEGGDKA